MILKIIVGFLLISVSAVLMVWGHRFLGEEKARNPRLPSKDTDSTSFEHPCSSCGACQPDQQLPELSPPPGKNLRTDTERK